MRLLLIFATHPSPCHRGRPTALVAEDHADSRLLFRLFLESKGCRVLEAADGLEAVAAAERERPDLVLMDYKLWWMASTFSSLPQL